MNLNSAKELFLNGKEVKELYINSHKAWEKPSSGFNFYMSSGGTIDIPAYGSSGISFSDMKGHDIGVNQITSGQLIFQNVSTIQWNLGGQPSVIKYFSYHDSDGNFVTEPQDPYTTYATGIIELTSDVFIDNIVVKEG